MTVQNQYPMFKAVPKLKQCIIQKKHENNSTLQIKKQTTRFFQIHLAPEILLTRNHHPFECFQYICELERWTRQFPEFGGEDTVSEKQLVL